MAGGQIAKYEAMIISGFCVRTHGHAEVSSHPRGLTQFSPYWNDGQFRWGTIELDLGPDLGLLWSTDAQTDIARCGCSIPL